MVYVDSLHSTCLFVQIMTSYDDRTYLVFQFMSYENQSRVTAASPFGPQDYRDSPRSFALAKGPGLVNKTVNLDWFFKKRLPTLSLVPFSVMNTSTPG